MFDQDWAEFYAMCEMIARTCFVQRKNREEWEEQIRFLFELLSEYSLDCVKQAMYRHVKTQKFFPTPADITRLIEGSPEERSLAAWRLFLRAVGRYGYYDSVRFPDPAYHYAIGQLGGWERLCEELHSLTDREIQFRAKDWRQLYETGLRVASWDGGAGKVKVPGYLPGSFERDCRDSNRLGFVPKAINAETGETLDPAALGLEAPEPCFAGGVPEALS
jgi:hypothetical protein